MSNCSIPSNPDIAGVGVRTAIYTQVLLSFIPAVSAILDGNVSRHELQSVATQSTTTLILAFGLLISCIVQAFTLGLTTFHASIVLSMSWMNNTNVFIYFLLYVQRKHQEGTKAHWSAWRKHITNSLGSVLHIRTTPVDVVAPQGDPGPTTETVENAQPESAAEPSRGVQVAIFKRFALHLGSFHLTMMAALGIWLWSNPRSFGTSSNSECSVEYAHLAIFGGSFPFGSNGLRIFSLLFYALFLIPGVNLLLPMTAFLGIYILVDFFKPNAALPFPETTDANAPPPLQARPSHTSSVTPVCIGLVLLFAINIIFIVDIELTLRRNQGIQARGEAEWGFGQVLAVLLLLMPLRDIIEMLLARKEREKNREIMQALLGSMDSSKFADIIIEWLMQGVDPTTESKDRNHSVFEALALGRKWDWVEYLVNEKDLSVNKRFSGKQTALEVASLAKDWTGIGKLLALKADMNTVFTDGRTALEIAAVGKQWELVGVIAEKGADVNKRFNDTLGSTPLHLACSEKHIDCAKALIHFKANVNARDKAGRVPLHSACAKEDLLCVKMLLDSEADPCLRDDNGKAPPVSDLLALPGDPDLTGQLNQFDQLDQLDQLDRLDRLDKLGTLFLSQAKHTGNLDDISEAISTQWKAAELTPKGHADIPRRLGNLGCSLAYSFQKTGDLKDITDAILTQQQAVKQIPKSHADLPGQLRNLGNSLLSRFHYTGDIANIAEAIAAHQRSVQLTPEGHVHLPVMLTDLGISFVCRFERTGDMSDIAEAMTTLQKAVQLTPESDVDLPGMLSNLGNSFRHHFQRTGDMTDITQAIAVQQKAVQLTPEGHADLPVWITNLGTSFQHRFERTGDMADIAQAIATQQKAFQLTPKGHVKLPSMLSNLGISFQHRFQCTGNMTDIAQAIAAQQKAVQLTPEDHTNLPVWITNLGTSFQHRFERTGDMADITQAITTQQKAVQLTPEDHVKLPGMLSNLGTSFQHRFQRTGDMIDIVQAIAAQQKAIQLTPVDHVKLPGILSNLGVSFQHRFQRTGDMTDITEAIAAQQRAVQLTPEGHADLPGMLNNLGNSFVSRFQRIGDMTDIAQAIAAQQKAVQLTPEGHADLPGMFSNLGNSFQHRFQYTGNMPDIVQAISAQQKAVQLTPDDHANLPVMLSNLGNSFQSCFKHTGDMDDITQAITAQQKAVQLTPNGHVKLSVMLSDLGNSFQHRFKHAKSNEIGEQDCLEDMHASVKCFRAVTEDSTGASTVRLQCAMSWARLITYHNPESLDALVPLETAVRLLTLVAGLERTLEGRYGQLQHVTGIALEAAAAACRLECPGKAVEWLEQGRCLVWGQLNGLRTPMDDLQERDPQLAQHLTDVAKQLELAGSTRTAMNPLMDMSAKISLEEDAHSHLALAREWEELLLAARNIPGFESFLLPSSCSALLQNLPESGPIIVINSHQDRCDALALLHGSNQPLHIPLPNFSLMKANHYRHVLKDQLHSNWVRMQGGIGSTDKKLERTQERSMTSDQPDEPTAGDTLNGVLQRLWLEVAKPILDMLAYSRHDISSTPHRVWWCPTGVMSFLPIHAAGIYGGANPECLMDYVISSYTPTVATITDRVKSSCSIDMTASGLFLISQPNAPFTAAIPGTVKEVDEVYGNAMENGIRALKCEGDEISVEDCQRYMGEFSCVHLACHASQNSSNPLQSRFLLHKGQLSLLSIMQMNLKNADLAYLSACQTSTGEEKLSDEAVHLAAGMLAAGYRRVVATMWSIDDRHAAGVATDFYNYLWSNQVDVTGNGFDSSLSAHALHHALQQLRQRLGNSERDLLTWVPYVHFGY